MHIHGRLCQLFHTVKSSKQFNLSREKISGEIVASISDRDSSSRILESFVCSWEDVILTTKLTNSW